MSGFQKPLLAIASSNLPLVYRNPLQHLVTALPYAEDEILDTRIHHQVNRLIQEEMANMTEENYLFDLPMPRTKYSEIIQQEMDRMEKDVSMVKTNFEGKYQIEGDPETEKEIQDAINLTNIKEQHNQINHQNLELLNKFGAESWKMLISQQAGEKDRLNKHFDKVKFDLNEINAQRKFEQLEVKQKVDQYKHRIGDMKLNNQELELECLNLQDEVLLIQRKKMRLSD